ncbi:MAG: protein phosphatase 2C domain-containing protein [Planctomycetota bacterium]
MPNAQPENPDPSKKPAAPSDEDSILGDEAGRDLHAADTATTLVRPSLEYRECAACLEINFPTVDFCTRCGFPVSPEAEVPTAHSKLQYVGVHIQGKTEIRGRYRVTGMLSELGGVRSYSAIADFSTQPAPVILRVREKKEIPPPPPAGGPPDLAFLEEKLSSTEVISFHPGKGDSLDLEHGVLAHADSPHLPKVVDFFEEGNLRILVLSAAVGMPLLKAWSSSKFSEATKASWLEQIRLAIVALHRQYALFPTLEPSRVIIGPDGIARIRDVSGIMALPVVEFDPSWATLYTAPEFLSDPRRVGFHSDAYNFGALICSLVLRRELSPRDFERPGVPCSFVRHVPTAMPPLLRLLGKTFVADPGLRFPTPEGRNRDATGFLEIGEALTRCVRAVRAVRYDIAGWSSIGILRSNNEDSYSITHYRTGLGEYQREIALVCVADGMGGHASGEIASGLSVATVNQYFHRNGLSASSLLRVSKDHPLNSTKKCGELVKHSIHEANRRVRKAGSADAARAGMGCTLEVLLLVGSRAIVGHVGDSRVYHKTGTSLDQVTNDQTFVNQMVELGRLTPEEAAVHPRRGELSQAIGASPKVRPDRHKVELARFDWLIVCSDGLTTHVLDWEIDQILKDSENAETAARRLVNVANSRGGSDNCTIVVIRVY